MSDPNDLAAFLEHAWQHLRRGAADRRHPARYPVLATVAANGTPEARTVALRAARPGAGTLEVHTDTRTAKMEALRADPRAALHVWIPKADLQIRVTARVEIVTGAPADAAWEAVPQSARISYGTEPAPGTPIEHVHAYDKPPRRDRFAQLICHARMIDLVELGARHRRALYRAEDGWAGTWTAP